MDGEFVMQKALDYDVVVTGAGMAGLVSAVTASGLGQRAEIVEERRFGGTVRKEGYHERC